MKFGTDPNAEHSHERFGRAKRFLWGKGVGRLEWQVSSQASEQAGRQMGVGEVPGLKYRRDDELMDGRCVGEVIICRCTG